MLDGSGLVCPRPGQVVRGLYIAASRTRSLAWRRGITLGFGEVGSHGGVFWVVLDLSDTVFCLAILRIWKEEVNWTCTCVVMPTVLLEEWPGYFIVDIIIINTH